MKFEIIGSIEAIETFASGSAIREIVRLRKIYGRGRWRKCKGLHVFICQMARFGSLSYIGMKQPE